MLGRQCVALPGSAAALDLVVEVRCWHSLWNCHRWRLVLILQIHRDQVLHAGTSVSLAYTAGKTAPFLVTPVFPGQQRATPMREVSVIHFGWFLDTCSYTYLCRNWRFLPKLCDTCDQIELEIIIVHQGDFQEWGSTYLAFWTAEEKVTGKSICVEGTAALTKRLFGFLLDKYSRWLMSEIQRSSLDFKEVFLCVLLCVYEYAQMYPISLKD